MNFPGQINHGVAVLDEATTLPDATRVRGEVEQVCSALWDNNDLREFATHAEARPLTSGADLAGDWPAEDNVGDCLTFVSEVRR